MRSELLRLTILAGMAVSVVISCGRREEKDLRGELAAVAGKMAAEKDLHEVRFADLDGDGVREVILVYGPRELLDFDVCYKVDEDSWRITPLVNDKNNPREFISTRLDSIRAADVGKAPEIIVSSRLYDGNSMVKELHWHPTGYEVINQRTVLAKPERLTPSAAPQVSQITPASGESRTTSPGPETQAKIEAQPVTRPARRAVRPERPIAGTYMVKKGDTVIGIALALGVSNQDLEALNNNQLARRGLQIGQRITVPVPVSKREHVSVKIGKERYTVKAGDSLTSIAQAYGVSLSALKSWNPDLPENGTVKIGQKLYIHQAVVSISA